MSCMYMMLLSFFLLFSSISSHLVVHASSNSSKLISVDKFLRCFPLSTPQISKASAVVYTPTNASFLPILQAYIRNSRFNRSTTPKPVAIVTALDYSHVQSTVLCAKSSGLNLRIRSGGHDFEGLSYISHEPFVLLDMFNLRKVVVNLKEESGWVEAGATLGELYYEIAVKSNNTLAFPAGVCLNLGVGGHFTGGGYGPLMRKYGLSTDNLLDAQVVDSRGKILNRATMGEDLFWAIRGGGAASFCVILSWKVKLVRIPQTVTVLKVSTVDQGLTTNIINQWQQNAHLVDPNLFLRATVQVDRGNNNTTTTVRVTFSALHLVGSANETFSLLRKSFPLMGVKLEDCIEMSWPQSLLFWGLGLPKGTPLEVMLKRMLTPPTDYTKHKSDYVKTPIPNEGWESIWKKMIQLGPGLLMQFNPYGGRMNQIQETITPFPHRAGTMFKIQYYSFWDSHNIDSETKGIQAVTQLYDTMAPYVSKNPREAFLNYRDVDIGTNYNSSNGTGFGLAYFKANNFNRLLQVKARVDPDNFFRNEQSISLHYAWQNIVS